MTIVEELRTNRESGAKRLEAEYKAGLMTLARRFCTDEGDAEELVNRTFAAVVEGIDDYLEQSAFFGWMCQILSNIHAKDIRKKSHGIVVYPGVVPDVIDEDAEDRIFQEIDASLLHDAIENLPKEMQEAIVLHYFTGLSVQKIAKFLAIPEGTVKSRLHYARLALGAKLGANMKKPGGKAVLLALLLCGLTALGAAAWNLATSGKAPTPADTGTSHVASHMSSSEAEASGQATSDMQQAEASNLSTSQPFNFSTDFSGEQNMNITKTTRAAMLAAATLTTGATLPASGSTVYLNKSAEWSSDANAFSTASYWGDGSAAPGPGNDYIVANGRTLRVPNAEASFAGDSLQIGETGGTAGRLKITGNATKQTFSSLVLANGTCTDDREGNKSETVVGPVTVAATAAAPFIWSGSPNLNATHSGVYFEGAMSSAAGTKIVFADNGQPDYHVDLKGSLSGFAGTLEMQTSRSGFYSDSADGTRLVVYPGSGAAMPGTLSFAAGTSLYPSDKTVDFTVGSLAMAAGSRMRVLGDSTGAHSVFRVSGSFTFPAEDGGVFLEVSGLYKSADTLRTAIFSAPVASGFTAGTFRTAGDDGAAAFPRYTLECEDSGGVRTLYLVTRVVDPVNTSVSQNNCLNSPSMWQSGILSTDGAATTHDFYANKWIKTSNVTSDKAFSGSATLTLGAAATLAIENPRFTVSEFDLLNGAKIADDGYYYNTSDSVLAETGAVGLKTVRGAIRSPWKDWETCNLVGKAGAYFRHDGALSGGGTVYLHNAAGASNAFYELRGSNSGFFGAVKIGTDSAGTGKACLVVNSAINLGGPCKSFRADALTLSYGAVLWPKASMTLAEPTRGITVEQDAAIRTDDSADMTISENILWNGGGIEKTGTGSLALGGAASVASGKEAAAVLTISEGAFRPLSTNALSGVSLVFGTGTSMQITVPAADDGMRTHGVEPASVSLPQGGIAIVFDGDAAALSSVDACKAAIITVATEDAPGVRAGLNVARNVAGFNVQIAQNDNGDGTTTVYAKFGKGTVMIFR